MGDRMGPGASRFVSTGQLLTRNSRGLLEAFPEPMLILRFSNSGLSTILRAVCRTSGISRRRHADGVLYVCLFPLGRLFGAH